jgi:hypothetical protein
MEGIDIIGRIRDLVTQTRYIFNMINSMFVLQETGGTITLDGTEQDIYRVETPMGVFEPSKVLIDFTNQTVAETVIIRTYYRIEGGGAFVKKDEVTFIGVQDPELINVDLEPNRFGIRVTIERTAGGAIDYPWEVFFRS